LFKPDITGQLRIALIIFSIYFISFAIVFFDRQEYDIKETEKYDGCILIG
jgi:uncharacterized membrane protein